MQLGKDITAVVTGGASGLGAATAKALAAKGVKVAIFDLNEAAGQKLAGELARTIHRSMRCDSKDGDEVVGIA
jgi:NAD(P)-dependent dehydrogenase (short-subunit alcohol dehydrogenase family)